MQIQIWQYTEESPNVRELRTTLSLDPCDESRVDEEAVLEWLFRQFNRVDGRELLSLLPVKMTSLSTSDMVVFIRSDGNARWFWCAPFGWEERWLSPEGIFLETPAR